MHRVTYSIRQIAAAALPTVTDIDGVTRPAAEADLLHLGIVPLGQDLYSCVHQERRDPDTLEWLVHGPELPGEIVTEGTLRARHAQLPADVAPKVLRAQVIRSSDPAVPAVMLAQENVAGVAAALAEFVGDVAGAPLLDLSGPAAVLEEAQRLVEIPGNGIDRHLVSMATVDAGDLVEQDRIIPHSWYGESRR